MKVTKKDKLQAITETDVKPQWVTIANASKIFGLGRTKLNELMNARLVKFTRVKDKHQVRGRVLINYQSIQDLFESWAIEADTKLHD